MHRSQRALALPAPDLDRGLAHGRGEQQVEVGEAALDPIGVGRRRAPGAAHDRPRVRAAETAEPAGTGLEPLRPRDRFDVLVDAAQVARDHVLGRRGRSRDRGAGRRGRMPRRAASMCATPARASSLTSRRGSANAARCSETAIRRRGGTVVAASTKTCPRGSVAHDVEIERGVGDRPGHAAAGREAVPVVGRLHRHPSALRLEPEEPAERRRNPDRAAAVGRRGRRPRARRRPRRRCRRSIRRSSRRCPTGLRVAPHALGLGERQDRELRERRLREDHRAGAPRRRRTTSESAVAGASS